MQAEIILCSTCGGQGVESFPQSMGDGWLGKCLRCNGLSELLKIGSEVYPFVSQGVFRGKDGRFKSLENVEVMG